MRKIVLISCVSKKLVHAAKVRDIYVSPLFRLNLAYAESLKPDAIYVLSAKHGLLPLDDQIEPYELTLNTMGTGQIRAWASGVVSQLAAVADLKHDLFVFLAGDKYRKFLVPHLAHFEVPMDGLTIGRQLQFLSRRT
ncbi:MAG: hypothetical protein IPH41_04080 [Sulfuritalea sp.]|jgi:hypothetical protein|nr:hypothetical protein [Sulfuritalea sp.]MCC7313087.1 hypothetical protein [Sulfuritalea sp.]